MAALLTTMVLLHGYPCLSIAQSINESDEVESKTQNDDTPPNVTVARDEPVSERLDAVVAHMQYLTEHSYDQVGKVSTPMWLSKIDIRSNGLPKSREAGDPRRNAGASSGASLFWDQPSLVAAYELSQRTGCKCYTDAAQAYTQAYIDACLDGQSGMLWWGSDHEYDVVEDSIVGPDGDDRRTYLPRTPGWETMWLIDRSVVERQIRSMSEIHDTDPSLALAPDWVLIDSVCWLAAQDASDRQSLLNQAWEVARARFKTRHPDTGLITTAAIVADQVDAESTTELGVWAMSLLRAAQQSRSQAFQNMADEAISRWLFNGYDSDAGKYYRSIEVASRTPIRGANQSSGWHAEVFVPDGTQNPNHAMPMAETCLSLFDLTGKQIYQESVERWVAQIEASLPANQGHGAHAEDYGRVIHFLVRASIVMDEPRYRALAESVAQEAMKVLYEPKLGMFRSHPGEDVCESVDGPGYLLLALLSLEGSNTEFESALHF
ncbi:MAG: hypothetical protein ACR2NZ_17965 [Rubripirellula sp.]